MHIRKYSFRFGLVFLGFILCLGVFVVKLVLIQVFKSSHLAELAKKQHSHSIEIEPIRGTIYDRRLRPLALNVSVDSLYANTRAMTGEDKERVVREISGLLDIDPSWMRKRLSQSKYFVWIKRKISAEAADKIKEKKINGLAFIKESKRYYPNEHLAAHIIGFANIDNKGLEGIELAYDEYLKGKSGWSQILRDAKQRDLLIEKNSVAPRDGADVVLTIDETIQYIAETALMKGLKKHNAKAASIIVMDTRTGEILALANIPTYNLEDFGKSTTESRTNRAISYFYEPGSVFKIVTAAAALEKGVFDEKDIIFCENGKYRIANHTLTDHHPHGRLTFHEVIKYSSNIGTVKVAQKLGADLIYYYGQRFRFGHLTEIDLHGEVSGLLKRPSQWSKTTIGAIPIGYEVTVTPLQLVAAMTAIANDGLFLRPFVVKYIKDNQDVVLQSFQPKVVDRVISASTAQRLKVILKDVVVDGTAKQAQIKNVTVAGKTGTARKVGKGGYIQGKYYATFVGFAPVENPRVAAVVVYDEPHPSYFGGTVAGPVFKEVVENTLRYLETTR